MVRIGDTDLSTITMSLIEDTILEGESRMRANTQAVRRNRGWRISLCLLTTIVVLTVVAASHAQTLIGSPGAGFQTWSTTNGAQPSLGELGDLNSNGAPYWDVPFLAFGSYSGTPAAKSIGWCLTSNGDCQGIGSKLFAPGALPFWGMPYDATADNPTGPKPGALDQKMYFRSNSTGTASYRATLYLNSATNTSEINEFGWFETDSTGSVNGTKHIIFNGSGFPPGTQTPDPVGKTVTFTPTHYFGYYYQDVSDEEDTDTSNAPPPHGCYALTIFTFNDEDCTAAGDINNTGQGDHVFAIFHDGGSSYWVAGQDPSMCNHDGDCNLTIVRVTPVPRD
jgi:hypothetical protein